jgi:hypothetical protein
VEEVVRVAGETKTSTGWPILVNRAPQLASTVYTGELLCGNAAVVEVSDSPTGFVADRLDSTAATSFPARDLRRFA